MRKVIPPLLFALILIPQAAKAYKPYPTHQNLTRKIVEVYNFIYNPDISVQEAEAIIEGSAKEDSAPRWINHFYNPKTGESWQGQKQAEMSSETVNLLAKILLSIEDAVSAPKWAEDENLQSKYVFYEGNQTFKRSLQAYAYASLPKSMVLEGYDWATLGNSYKSLGHVLHLIEDMGVPAHVRNDTHADVAVNGDAEPYETWLTLNNNSDLSFIKAGDLEKINCQNLKDCFDQIANYTYDNFYSKDTIEKLSENLPKKQEGNCFLYYKEINKAINFPLVKTCKNEGNEYSTIDDPRIHRAYWQLLAPKIIATGVEVVHLYHQERLKEEENVQYPQHLVTFKKIDTPVFSLFGTFTKTKEKAAGLFGQVSDAADKVQGAITRFLFPLFGNTDEYKEVAEIEIKNETGAEIQLEKSENNLNNENFSALKKENETLRRELENLKKETAKKAGRQSTSKKSTMAKDSELNQKNIAVVETEIQDNQEKGENNTKISEKSLTSECLLKDVRGKANTSVVFNEIAWMGSKNSSADEWFELKNISSSAINISGWKVLNKSASINIQLSDLKNKTIQPGAMLLFERTDDNSVHGVKADLIYSGAISNSNEQLVLLNEKCEIVDEVASAKDWIAGSESEKRTMERVGNSTSWQTSFNPGGTPKKENSKGFTASASVSSGSQAFSQNQSSAQKAEQNEKANYPKIIITEVQLASKESSKDEFIELYNPGNNPVSLTGWYLHKKTKTAAGYSTFVPSSALEGKNIPAKGYFVIANPQSKIIYDAATDYGIAEDNLVALKDPNGDIKDFVGLGENADCAQLCAPNPKDGESLGRIYENSVYKDTDIFKNDFRITTCPNPGNENTHCETVLSGQQEVVGADHIVISEFMAGAGTGKANEEFIELYNPTDQDIHLEGWSLKRKATAEAENMQSIVSSFPNVLIPAKRFLLIASSEYAQSEIRAPEVLYSSSNHFAYDEDVVVLIDSAGNFVDEMLYEKIEAGKSLERKALASSTSESMHKNDAFLGNGFDSDGPKDFVFRDNPQPQNSSNLPEPRNAPDKPENFSTQYKKEEMTVTFSWQGSGSEYTVYLNEKGIPKEVQRTKNLFFSLPIREVGREFEFIIEAIDEEGMHSVPEIIKISVPSFLSGFNIYKDPRENSNAIFIEGYYNEAPIIPGISQYKNEFWKMIRFYINGEMPGIESSSTPGEVAIIKYPQCAGGNAAADSLIIPDIKERCGTSGGAYNNAINWDAWSEDKHFIIELDERYSSLFNSENVDKNYLTAVFYTTGDIMPSDGRVPYFGIVAADRTKYYFEKNEKGKSLKQQKPPAIVTNLRAETLNGMTSAIHLTWDSSPDPDTLDEKIIYEVSLELNESSVQTERTKQKEVYIPVSFQGEYECRIKACDDFNNCSESVSISHFIGHKVIDYTRQSGSAVYGGQTLGGGLNGKFESLMIKHTEWGANFSVAIKEFSDDAYASLTNQWLSGAISGGSETANIISDNFIGEIIFDPQKFYLIQFMSMDGRVYGSSDSTAYSNGSFFASYDNGVFVWDETVKDMYFVLKTK